MYVSIEITAGHERRSTVEPPGEQGLMVGESAEVPVGPHYAHGSTATATVKRRSRLAKVRIIKFRIA